MKVLISSAFFFAAVAHVLPATAQEVARGPSPRDQHREKINETVIYLMGGQLGGGYLKLAHDVSVALQDEQNLRVLPVVGGAAVQNVRNILFLKGIDLALTTVQALNLLKESNEVVSDKQKSASDCSGRSSTCEYFSTLLCSSSTQ